eukprot:COSAG02_NODE_1507_length_12231_cov_56.431751_3_plen_98_part_00
MTVKIDLVTMTLPVVGPDQLWIFILYLDEPRLVITGRRGVRLMGNLVVDRVACTHANEALLLSQTAVLRLVYVMVRGMRAHSPDRGIGGKEAKLPCL